MSVENQVGDSPGKGVAQKMDDHKPTVLEEKSTATEEVVDHSLKDEAITTQSDEVTESSSFSTKEDSPSAVRRWFEDLSAKERVSALSFVDRSFLGALLELASWSEANAETLEFDQHTGINWGAPVSMKELKDRYVAFEKALGDSNNGADSSNENDDGPTDDVEDGAVASKHEETSTEKVEIKAEVAASDAFTIRADAEERSEGSASKARDDSLRVARAIFDEMRLIFPSAFKHASGTVLDERSPLATISPSYLDASSEELVPALDALACSAFGVPFCHYASSDSTKNTSLMKVLERLSLGNDCMSDDLKLPIHVFLLARLESAVFDAFEARDHRESLSKNPSLSKRPTVDAIKLVDDVCSHAHAMGDLTIAIDDETLKGFMAPFFEMCLTSAAGGPSWSLEHLVLTPLSYLLHAKDTAGRVDFEACDSAVKSALAQMSGHGSSNETQESNKEGDRPSADEEAESLSCAMVPEPVTRPRSASVSTAGGRKKKKKKRKKRKTSNADTLASIPKKVVADDPEALCESKEGFEATDAAPVPTMIDTTREEAEPKPDLEEVDIAGLLAVEETMEAAAVIGALSVEEATPSDSATTKGDITVSGLEAVLVVAPPLSASQPSLNDEVAVEEDDLEEHDAAPDTGDAWETVEARQRSARKKPGDRSGHSSSRRGHYSSHGAMSNGDGHGHSKRGKGTRHTATRKRAATKKVAKDLLASILDRVDDEVRKKKHSPPQTQLSANSWKQGSPFVGEVANVGSELDGRKVISLHGRVHGKQNHGSCQSAGSPSFTRNGEKPRLPSLARPSGSPRKIVSTIMPKLQALSPADQSTAPTYQETISATSATSNVATVLKGGEAELERREAKSDSDATDEAPRTIGRTVLSPVKPPRPQAPPLPTLLSPKIVNSANSSVASSLEVPHTRRHRSNSAADVNDVGYHLLDVCDRLSRDMSLFMSRRALALNARRRERGALLTVLQDTVAGIWPGRCHVELYGSCATQLDLPASDLDVVVRGMDPRLDAAMLGTLPILQGPANQGLEGFDQIPASSFLPMSMHMNGERVRRLASSLEQQPWAVQVNAIPTASVPVVKILADPSKLPGIPMTVQHQQMAAQAAVASGQAPTHSDDSAATGRSHFQLPHQPWRGADVMNGLLSLDITFEGPEHGGIGSTEFSANVVSEICHETGLMPDATPFVQVLMVLKELLAQRKLNEPFSGGLSSYAILLLVVALLRERAVIREELDRVERQRKAVAAGGVSSFAGAPDETATTAKQSSSNAWGTQAKKQDANKASPAAGTKGKQKKTLSKATEQPAWRAKATSARSAPVPSSSWASIAKTQTSVDDSNHHAKESATKTYRASKTTPNATGKTPSFADAVAKSATATTATQRKKVAGVGREEADKTARKQAYEAHSPQPSAMPPKAPTEETKTSPLGTPPSFFPQGYNDVIEVLCSGETTAGKLLMHFLLYYGQHFEAQGTAIDVSGKHDRSFAGQLSPYSPLSSFIPRQAPGTIDPVTGMLTVDPIVIYDPLEGAEYNNVARRCFAWNSIRWIFAQSYATLSSAVERSATPPASPGGNGKSKSTGVGAGNSNTEMSSSAAGANDPDAVCDLLDPSSPLLKCLLSF